MNANLDIQLNFAHDSLSQANMREDLTLAKFALGLFAGAAASVVPEEEISTVLSIAQRGSEEPTVHMVTSAAVALKNMAEQNSR